MPADGPISITVEVPASVLDSIKESVEREVLQDSIRGMLGGLHPRKRSSILGHLNWMAQQDLRDWVKEHGEDDEQ